MTRKQALHKALEALEALATTEESTTSEVQNACDVIRAMVTDLPLTGWTERTIFDSIDQFITDRGRTPTTSDFRKKCLPPHPVIKLRFGMTLREFLDAHYPVNKLCPSKVYFTETKEHWRDLFLTDYHNNKPCSAEEHNANRTNGTPSWQTTAKMFGVVKWVDWLNFCGIIPYINKREYIRNTVNTPPIQVTSVITYTGADGYTIRVTKDENGVICFV